MTSKQEAIGIIKSMGGTDVGERDGRSGTTLSVSVGANRFHLLECEWTRPEESLRGTIGALLCWAERHEAARKGEGSAVTVSVSRPAPNPSAKRPPVVMDVKRPDNWTPLRCPLCDMPDSGRKGWGWLLSYVAVIAVTFFYCKFFM
jgi:hypothetical protein